MDVASSPRDRQDRTRAGRRPAPATPGSLEGLDALDELDVVDVRDSALAGSTDVTDVTDASDATDVVDVREGARDGADGPDLHLDLGDGAPAPGLTDRQREVLAFERQWWRHQGAKEQAVRELFDLSATRYYQVLNALLDHPAALAADPMLVKRLHRLRGARAATRSARPPTVRG